MCRWYNSRGRRNRRDLQHKRIYVKSAIVDASGIQRSNIVFELEEDSFYEDKEFLKSKLNQLRELGFKVWLDNYGSSYSSIDVLPLDLKIEMMQSTMMRWTR
ncbi:EAL domain-containing protein [Pseudobutyrivibrio sp. OR37]|uniref:EAL domain-containing protein n=1 Tax=Pseudobutyrivibrio sp. OR37 TaxID=1798186 RepID=UPI000B876AD9